MPRSLRVALAITTALAVAAPTVVRADDYTGPTIPTGEFGFLLPLTARRQETTDADSSGTEHTGVGLAIRAEVSVIALALRSFVRLRRARFGELLGVDIGLGSQGATGRLVLGLQASYELTDELGLGARVYYLTAIQSLFADDFFTIFTVGEVSGRYRKVIGRVRFSIDEDKNSDLGASVRIPTGLDFLGIEGWHVGVDYDRMAVSDSTGTATLHHGVLVLGVVLGL